MTYVVLPLDVVEGNGVDILIEDQRSGDEETRYSETFGSNGIGQNFNGV